MTKQQETGEGGTKRPSCDQVALPTEP